MVTFGLTKFNTYVIFIFLNIVILSYILKTDYIPRW